MYTEFLILAYTLFSFSTLALWLLDTHLSSAQNIHASILLVLDVRSEGLAINSLKAQA